MHPKIPTFRKRTLQKKHLPVKGSKSLQGREPVNLVNLWSISTEIRMSAFSIFLLWSVGLRKIIDVACCSLLYVLFLLAIRQCIKRNNGQLFTFNFGRYNGAFKYLLFHLKSPIMPYQWTLEDKHKHSLQPGLNTLHCFYRSCKSSHQSWFHSSDLQNLGKKREGSILFIYTCSFFLSPLFVNNKSILIKLLYKTEIILFYGSLWMPSKSCLAAHLSLVNYPSWF